MSYLVVALYLAAIVAANLSVAAFGPSVTTPISSAMRHIGQFVAKVAGGFLWSLVLVQIGGKARNEV